MITLYAFNWVPDFAKGHVRDLRVRWALEEAGLAYVEKLIDHQQKTQPDYLALQPFGQVPAIEYDGLRLFESGAIVLHIARMSARLMPADPDGRGRAEMWIFAALNSVEPSIANLADIDIFAAGQDWAKQRRPAAVEAVQRRLDQLEGWLGEQAYLEEDFSAGDLMMATVLRGLDHTDIVERRPTIKAYRDRCLERPGFRKALADQLRAFEGNGPPAASV